MKNNERKTKALSLSLQILSQHILKNQKRKKKIKRLFKCKLYSKYLCMYCMYVCLSLCVCVYRMFV